jgi:hypothetical protein
MALRAPDVKRESVSGYGPQLWRQAGLALIVLVLVVVLDLPGFRQSNVEDENEDEDD